MHAKRRRPAGLLAPPLSEGAVQPVSAACRAHRRTLALRKTPSRAAGAPPEQGRGPAGQRRLLGASTHACSVKAPSRRWRRSSSGEAPSLAAAASAPARSLAIARPAARTSSWLVSTWGADTHQLSRKRAHRVQARRYRTLASSPHSSTDIILQKALAFLALRGHARGTDCTSRDSCAHQLICSSCTSHVRLQCPSHLSLSEA